MSETYEFYVSGMSCVSCSKSIEYNLKESKQIKFKSFTVDITTPDPKLASVTIADDNGNKTETANLIKTIIIDAGFDCEYKVPTVEASQAPFNNKVSVSPPISPSSNWLLKVRQFISSHWFLGSLGTISGIGLLILTLATGPMPLAALIPIAISSTILTLILGARSYQDAWKKFMASQTLTMDTLFSISTITVLLVSITSLFVPWLPMMFEASLLIYGFRHIGIAIEDAIKEKVNPIKFQDRAPKSVRLIVNGELKEVPLNSIKPNDVISILPGEIIPVDGDCENECIVYNTIVTGSILPKHFQRGTAVVAGMKLAKDSAELKILVKKPVGKSNLAQLDYNIAQSIKSKAPIEKQTDKILQYFIPSVLALSALSGLVIGIFFPAAIAIKCAISVLVSACPCTLGLITPLAVKTGIHKALEHGALFKNAEMLQLADRINTILLDLNGTLTTGIPVVRNYNIMDRELSDADFYAICTALEEGTEHPIGKAIFDFTKGHKTKQFTLSKHDKSHHSGISAYDGDIKYAIGNRDLMHDLGISTDGIENRISLDAGDSLIYVARDKVILGYHVVTDPLRKDAIKMVQALQSMGIEVHLCTGADEPTARRYAKELGIKHVYANSVASNTNPGQRSKPAYILTLRSEGKIIAMVGDAGNDAHALAAADLGIAVLSESSDEMTKKQAGVIIQQGNLLPIANGLAIAKQAISNINSNLKISLGYNLAAVLVSGGLLLSIGMTLNPAVGVALMILQACFVLMSVYQFKQQSLPHLENEIEHDSELMHTSYDMMKQYSLSQNSPQPASTEAAEPADSCSIPIPTINFFQGLFDCINKPQINGVSDDQDELCTPTGECPPQLHGH